MGPKKQQKQQLEQAAWAWAEYIDDQSINSEHVDSAYRINVTSCKLHHCRRNCKANPRCVNSLGEGRWYQEIKDSAWYEVEDPNKERREEGAFAGLKNLGATCYVNTFLQVWFHNPEIRRAVFQWQDTLSEEDIISLTKPLEELVSDMRTDELDKLLEPRTVCGNLQAVFAQLQFSKRRYIDPTPFINSLGLDAALQQDAQEFSKLFMCLLEDTLSQENSPERNFIQQQFLGHYQYITSCNGCRGESRRSSQFYELDLNIQGHKNLHDCIGEFLQEEKLEGENQYACSICRSKQNATRSIRLQTLPPVFNLQLLRFVFDRKTGHKKKLNTFIEFAEQLDMSRYMGKEEGEVIYDLTAVLIHRGPSAYSGHYIAHIKDRKSGHWFKFNDEEVEKMGGKKLELGNEDELEGHTTLKGPNRPKTCKGFHASRNAYMLVYKARQPDGAAKVPVIEGKVTDLPMRMQKFLDLDEHRFEQWIAQMGQMRENSVTSGKSRQEEAKMTFVKLPWQDGEQFDWVTTAWLSSYFVSDYVNKVQPIDNKELLCVHDKMDPEKVSKAKCISKSAADELFSFYKGGPRLDRTSLCQACVRFRARGIRMRTRIAEDQKAITAFLKTKHIPTDLMEHYWVGKLSLRAWKRFAMEQLEALESPAALLAEAANDSAANNSEATRLGEAASDCKDNVQAADAEMKVSDSGGEKTVSSTTPSPVVEETTQASDLSVTQMEIPSCTPCALKTGDITQSKDTSNTDCDSVPDSTMPSQNEESKGYTVSAAPPLSSKTIDKPVNGLDSGVRPTSSESTTDLKQTETTKSSISSPTISSNSHTGNSVSSSAGTSQPTASAKQVDIRSPTAVKANGGSGAATGDGALAFNDDVLCEPHDNMVIEDTVRRLVPVHIWRRLKHYFPAAPEYRGDAPPCPKCMAELQEEIRVKEVNKAAATEQKAALANLYMDRNRPTWSGPHTQLYIVSASFLDAWRRFLKDPARFKACSAVNNRSLLCPHSGFMHEPATLTVDARTQHLKLISPDEWAILKQYVMVDVDICISRIQEDTGHVTFLVSPEQCVECQEARQVEEQLGSSTFKHAIIYIRKQLSADVVGGGPKTLTSKRRSTSSSGTVTPSDENSMNGDKGDDPEFIHENGKRKMVVTHEPEKALRFDDTVVRRSSRHRRSPGEKQISVSSTDTLRDLKLKIMELFSVAPFDQNLTRNGKALSGDMCTLSSLHVQPGDILILKEDEPSEDPTFLEEAPGSHQEEGFKGTGLLSR